MAESYTPEAIEILASNPNVRSIDMNRLTLTYGFRVKLYDDWTASPCVNTIRTDLLENGFDLSMLPPRFISNLQTAFKRNAPSRGQIIVRKDSLDNRTSKEDMEELLGTGKFVKVNSGLSLEPSFRDELLSKYPQQSVEQGLLAAGIDPKKVGYLRIMRIQKLFNKALTEADNNGIDLAEQTSETKEIGFSTDPVCDEVSSSESENTMNESSNAPEIKEASSTADDQGLGNDADKSTDSEKTKSTGRNPATAVPAASNTRSPTSTLRLRCSALMNYPNHPYVEIRGKSAWMSEAFYNEASGMTVLGIEEIFNIYEIRVESLPEHFPGIVFRILKTWEKTDQKVSLINEQTIRIQKARSEALEKKLLENYAAIKSSLPTLSCKEKKKLCLALNESPTFPQFGYSKERIISLAGFTKSHFYRIVESEGYGLSEEIREEQDLKDAELIREVAEYKGFSKGLKQIYMQLPRLKGVHFSMDKIRRISKKYNIVSNIRKPTSQRKAARDRREKFEKPNLLRRRFRLHHPLEVRLTDVTYLDYGSILSILCFLSVMSISTIPPSAFTKRHQVPQNPA